MASNVVEATQQIFISYSRRDYYLAESLSLQLVSRGLSAWMDVLELQPGADWERSLFEAIDGCAAFVLVASPAALASPHVRDCANHAEATSDITDCIVLQQRASAPQPGQLATQFFRASIVNRTTLSTCAKLLDQDSFWQVRRRQ